MITISSSHLDSIDRASLLYKKLVAAHDGITHKIATTWGPEAAVEAAIRLNWVDLPSTSRDLLPVLDALCAKFRGFKELVLCGMGGSSLAPEVIAKTFGKNIFILDSTDPHYISHALPENLSNTLVVVSSKSGSTIETASQRAFFEAAFLQQGATATEHMIFVTDPGSPLDIDVRNLGYTVINADPKVGGRFSALTAFGLVPAALMGVDTSVLLDHAEESLSMFLLNPQIVLDVAFLLSAVAGQFIGFSDAGSRVPGLSDWIEQLIAESTGKSQTGRLPIAAESVTSASVGGAFTISFAPSAADLVVEGDLGSHFIFWEWVTALVGAALAIDPFNQPNVTEAKEQTSALLAEWDGVLPELSADAQDGVVEIFGVGNTLRASLKNLIANTDADGYIAIMAYLDRRDDAKLVELRAILSEKSGRPVTFGWGPRFLHSTGQFHKGGQQNGSFLQITGISSQDFHIPGRSFGFKTLIMAQALGDGRALASRKYPLLRFHLTNRSAGVDELLAAARSL